MLIWRNFLKCTLLFVLFHSYLIFFNIMGQEEAKEKLFMFYSRWTLQCSLSPSWYSMFCCLAAEVKTAYYCLKFKNSHVFKIPKICAYDIGRMGLNMHDKPETELIWPLHQHSPECLEQWVTMFWHITPTHHWSLTGVALLDHNEPV